SLNARLKFVASDNPEAAGLKTAQKMGFPTEILNYGTEGRRGAERQLDSLCSRKKVEWIVLAGFMRILSPEFVTAHRGRIVNIHPSLLPSFPGRDGIGDAWRYGVKITGVTVHLVDEGVDSGPILSQTAVPVRARDTLESLEKRIHRSEHGLYWKTLAALFSGVTVSERS
ncbi:MAG: phosphoribosylglycinamide formyltransferase, partial [Aminivibrio sp.]|nr:phosphoribosylglycinamide formyltransferase [Aminivibrio sp.]